MHTRKWLACFTAALLASATLAASAATPPDVAQVIEQLGLEAGPAPVRERAGWRPLRKIVVQANLAPDAIRYLAPVAAGARIIVVASPADALKAAPGADAFFGFCEADLLAAAPDVRWVQAFSAGVERCVALPAIRTRDIVVTNMQRALGPPMAEHALALLLALARHLDTYIARDATGTWDEATGRGAPVRVLAGKTLLVVGLGGIGTEVARLANAIGMRVIATRASGRAGPPFVEHVGKPDQLLEFAGRADAVVAALPLTAETRSLFDAKFFAAMKPGAYFVNLGRGASVVTDALVAALKSGQVGGAGLDVTDPEPLPPNHPLWRAPRSIITPHMSATTDADAGYRRTIVRENLRRWQAGEALLSVVDVRRGY
ncbi:MAG: D-2-hydroxyacid dehydrogenase [Steroidobacteraceae bacterium]